MRRVVLPRLVLWTLIVATLVGVQSLTERHLRRAESPFPMVAVPRWSPSNR